MWTPKNPLHISYKYFVDQIKIVYFKQNTDFWHFVNKPLWCREFHVQQGKHTPNSYSLLLLSCFTCANLFTVFCGTANSKLFNVPTNF